ncbi:ParB N-terminal domain-containing protein [Saccharopolyspora sp. NPDC003762]
MATSTTAAALRRELAQQRPLQVGRVSLDKLRFHPLNIRSDLGDLRTLTASIAAEGILQPLLAHRYAGGGEVLDGHRRLAAARLAGLRTAPTMILPCREPDEAICIMLATALTGSGLLPEDRRRAVRALLDSYGHTARDLADRFGVRVSTVNNWAAAPGPDVVSPKRTRRRAPTVGARAIHSLVENWRPRVDSGLSADQASALLEELAALVRPAGAL